MAYGKKTGGRDWKKGDPSPNPKGRAPLPPEVREFRRLTLTELQGHISAIKDMSVDELESLAADKGMPALRAWIYAMALQGIRSGSERAFDSLMDRVVGRVADQVNITGKLTAEIKAKSDAELSAEALALVAAIRGEKK